MGGYLSGLSLSCKCPESGASKYPRGPSSTKAHCLSGGPILHLAPRRAPCKLGPELAPRGLGGACPFGYLGPCRWSRGATSNQTKARGLGNGATPLPAVGRRRPAPQWQLLVERLIRAEGRLRGNFHRGVEGRGMSNDGQCHMPMLLILSFPRCGHLRGKLCIAGPNKDRR